MAIDGVFCDLCADKIANKTIKIRSRNYDICTHCEMLCVGIEREESTLEGGSNDDRRNL